MKIKTVMVGALLALTTTVTLADNTVETLCTVTGVKPHYNVTVRYYESDTKEEYSTQRTTFKDGYTVAYSCFGDDKFEYVTTKEPSVGDDLEVMMIVLPK